MIDLGISAVTHRGYRTLFRTEVAQRNGATAEEIEDAVHYAKSAAGRSTYLIGMRADYGQFAAELKRVENHVRSVTPH